MNNTQSLGSEVFTFAGASQNFTLCDFWRWLASDLMNNLTRGRLAEFIVARALGIHESGPMAKWDPYNLLFEDRRIEVKASAYIQEWDQPANTNPRFSIRPAKKLIDATRYGGEARRNCDMYIFCILAEMDREAASPLRLDKWEFYPVLTSELNVKLGAQKSIGMNTICRMCPEPFTYASLHDAVSQLFEKDENPAMF